MNESTKHKRAPLPTVAEMEKLHNEGIKATLDPRQFLATQRFTHFKPEKDKSSVFFHAVGTGKTLSSLQMMTYYLKEENHHISQILYIIIFFFIK